MEDKTRKGEQNLSLITMKQLWKPACISVIRPAGGTQDETIHLRARNGIYIIDLLKTVRLFKKAYTFVQESCAQGNSVLFVGTKKQAQDAVYEEASLAAASITSISAGWAYVY